MATVKRNSGNCVICGEHKKVKDIFGEKTCTMCEVLLSRIKKHPEMVVKQLQKLAPQALSSLSHTPSHIDNSADLKVALEELQTVHDKQSKNYLALLEDFENVKRQVSENAIPGQSLLVDRDAIKDLALRISVGVMRGDVSELGLNDIELLRSI